ncbi:hypothetical protein EMCRGX_G011989 [Ephydatia muelleri]
MNKVVRMLEAEMKMDQVLKGITVEFEIDTKNSSLAGQALDMCLKLVAPEYSHKPWNGHKEFIHFLEQRNNHREGNRSHSYQAQGFLQGSPSSGISTRISKLRARISKLRDFYKGLQAQGFLQGSPSSGISTRVSKLRDFYKGLQAQGFLQGSPSSGISIRVSKLRARISKLRARISKLRDFYKGLQAQGFLQGSPSSGISTRVSKLRDFYKGLQAQGKDLQAQGFLQGSPSSGISTRVSKLRDFYKGLQAQGKDLQAQGFLQGSPSSGISTRVSKLRARISKLRDFYKGLQAHGFLQGSPSSGISTRVSKLRDFYKGLHISLGKPISEQYTRFTKPEFSGVSDELFQGIQNNYKPEVLNSVSEMANEYMEDVVKLTSLMLPHLQQVLARQRSDYGIDEESFPQQEQASNIDDTHQCTTLVWRGSVVRWTIGIYRAAALAKREVELLWSEQTKANFARESTEKQEMAQRQERKRLDMLNSLKSLSGPFTDAVEVVKYLAEPTLSEKVKQQRLKLEVQFARESTTLLPKVDPLFRIQITLPNGKMWMKTAVEFGEALICYLAR